MAYPHEPLFCKNNGAHFGSMCSGVKIFLYTAAFLIRARALPEFRWDIQNSDPKWRLQASDHKCIFKIRTEIEAVGDIPDQCAF